MNYDIPVIMSLQSVARLGSSVLQIGSSMVIEVGANVDALECIAAFSKASSFNVRVLVKVRVLRTHVADWVCE